MDARIPLVKDDPSFPEISALVLRGAGFEVVTVADGVEALHRWGIDAPDP